MRKHPNDMLINEQVFHRKIHCLTAEFHSKFHAKNRHRTNRCDISFSSESKEKRSISSTREPKSKKPFSKNFGRPNFRIWNLKTTCLSWLKEVHPNRLHDNVAFVFKSNGNTKKKKKGFIPKGFELGTTLS